VPNESEESSASSTEKDAPEMPQKNPVWLVPSKAEYIFDPRTGSVRLASRVGMSRKERKSEEKAAKKARVKELKARKK
jgi:hypothetical protein